MESKKSEFDSAWSAIRLVGVLFAALLSLSFLAGLIAKIYSSPWLEVILSGIDALIIVGFVVHRYREVLPFLRVPHLTLRRAAEVVGISLAFVIIMSSYFALLSKLGLPLLQTGANFAKAGWSFGWILVLVSLMPSCFEELAFRGIIQGCLEEVIGWREALIVQAALFSVLHLLPAIFPSHFFMGLCFGFLRLRTKSLYPGMLLHATWNALVVSHDLLGLGAGL
jgi:membrane protease YdiL (CAAX protease family)